MLGKTHMAVGAAATLAVIQPSSAYELVLALGGGVVGALISDIDVGTSESHRDADVVSGLAVISVAVALALDFFLGIGIVETIRSRESLIRIVGGLLLFIGICAFGKEQPHRSFMHSILALLALSLAVFLIYPPLVPYFGVGFLSHLASDIFNRKQVWILYPFTGFSLNLFSAKGIANQIFFVAGCILTGIEIVLFVLRVTV